MSGVGNGAHATIVGNAVAAMKMLKGSVVVTINVQGNLSLQNITVAALTAVGKTVAGRL